MHLAIGCCRIDRVSENDVQGRVDHVDSHCTVPPVARPYARKNHASHVNASFSGPLKTVFRLPGSTAGQERHGRVFSERHRAAAAFSR